jgi:hypothetical protein
MFLYSPIRPLGTFPRVGEGLLFEFHENFQRDSLVGVILPNILALIFASIYFLFLLCCTGDFVNFLSRLNTPASK